MARCGCCRRTWSRVALTAGMVATAGLIAAAPPEGRLPVDREPSTAAQLLERLPLLFVPEQVAADGSMGYVVHGNEATVWLASSGLTYRLHPTTAAEASPSAWVVAMDLVEATPRQPVGQDLLPTRVSYFKGTKEQWRTGLSSYGSVVYREPWRGVDMVVTGTAGELKSTFVVRPGADPSAIRLAYRGASAVRLDSDGSLVADTPLGSITEQPPVAYQEINGERVEVAAAFELEPNAELGWQTYHFSLGAYDPSHELVVDPVTLVYCGYIGGSDLDWGNGIAVDEAGNAYVTGITSSTEATFPVVAGPDLIYNAGDYDAFVAKVGNTGDALEYCGYIGGSGIDRGYAITVDATGSAYVTGETTSDEATFPVSVGPGLTYHGTGDAFIAKVTASGTGLEYCGYVGGSDYDSGRGIAVDTAGNAHLTGDTSSAEATFPVTVGPDLTYNGSGDAFIAKITGVGSGLHYCGYIGGTSNDGGRGIAVDTTGNVVVAGYTASTEATFPVTVGPDLTSNGDFDAFVAKVNTAGSAVIYCGYVGGAGADHARGIAVDNDGNAYVTGYTFSTEATFPVTVGPDLTFNGDRDSFVARVSTTGTGLDYCGYIGGSGEDWGWAIAANAAGNAFVTGPTTSSEATFPVTVGPDLTYNGDYDAFVARVDGTGSELDYCGYIGGSGYDGAYAIAVDDAGNAYVVGETSSTEATFPVTIGPDSTYNGGTNDAFVAKVNTSDIFADSFESGDTAAWSVTVP